MSQKNAVNLPTTSTPEPSSQPKLPFKTGCALGVEPSHAHAVVDDDDARLHVAAAPSEPRAQAQRVGVHREMQRVASGEVHRVGRECSLA
jgi:hypothetical protein